jgi:hypothetical protein
MAVNGARLGAEDLPGFGISGGAWQELGSTPAVFASVGTASV